MPVPVGCIGIVGTCVWPVAHEEHLPFKGYCPTTTPSMTYSLTTPQGPHGSQGEGHGKHGSQQGSQGLQQERSVDSLHFTRSAMDCSLYLVA